MNLRNNSMFSILVLGFFMAPISQAAPPTLGLRPPLSLQQCRLLLQASGLPDSGFKEWLFGISEKGGPHGGAPQQFEEMGHQILVVADRQWLALHWSFQGRKVAAATFVIGSEDRTKDRVGIVESPFSDEERITISCGPLELR